MFAQFPTRMPFGRAGEGQGRQGLTCTCDEPDFAPTPEQQASPAEHPRAGLTIRVPKMFVLMAPTARAELS